jgi:hypothetical protein
MAKKDSIKMLEAKIEVLQRARKKFKTGMYPGICSAIFSSYNCWHERHLDAAGMALTDYISESLGNRAAYLGQWLSVDRPQLSRSDKNMKKYRLQWIDWMLSCLREDLASKTTKTRR